MLKTGCFSELRKRVLFRDTWFSQPDSNSTNIDDLIGYDALLQLKLANRVSQSSNELKLNHLKQ